MVISPRTLLVSLLLGLTIVGNASATSYFVTQSGAGNKTGLDLANAWSVANYNASNAPTGGDRVFFSGTITSQVSVATSGTGTGASNLTLDFTGATVSVTGTYGIFVSGKSHLTVLGGTFTSDGGDRTMFRCSTSGGSDILVSGWSYTGPSGGVSNFAIIGACTSITFENNTIDNIANGINQYEVSNNGPVIIRNNYIRDSVNNVTQSDIVNLGSTRNVLIEGNKFVQQAIAKTAGLHDDVLQTYAVGGSGQCPAGFTIRYNWVELNKTQSDSGDSSWSMFEAMCDGTSGFAVKFYSNVFDSGDNFFSGGNGYGCSTSTSSAHCYVYNNTMIRHNGPNGGVGGSGGASFYFSNNAGESDAGNTDGGDFNIGSGHYQQGAPYDHNWSYRLNGCDSSVSGPHGSCNTDPKFSDFAGHNYALQSSSPLVNAGDDTIGSEYNQGPCPGATWPNPTLCTRTAGHWDVGAYQSGGGDPPPDPPTGLNAQVN